MLPPASALQNSGSPSTALQSTELLKFPRAAVTKYHNKLGGLNKRNGLFQSSRGRKAKIKTLASRFLLRVATENVVHVSLLDSGSLKHSVVCRWHSAWVFTLFSLCMCTCVLSPFSRVQLFATLWTGPPGSSLHGILQVRILEWVAMPSSRGSF